MISASVSRSAVILEPFCSLIFAFRDPMEYHKKGFFASKVSLQPKVLTRNWIALSSVIAFVSYLLTAGIEENNSPTMRFTSRSKMRLVIMVARIDSFKTSTTLERFLHSTFFFIVGLESTITIFWPSYLSNADAGGGSALSICFHSPNLMFFDIT